MNNMYDLLKMPDDPDWWKNRVMSPEMILNYFQLYGCSYFHNGDPKKPHVELSGGLCSGGYFDCRELFSRKPRLCAIFADQLVRKLSEAGLVGQFDWVIGSSYSAITVSYEVAKILGISHGFTEKKPNNPEEQVWNGNIPEGSKILQVEDVITTLGTAMEVRRTVAKDNHFSVEFLSCIATLIHRPPKLPADYGDTEVIPLVELAIWAVPKDKCIFCKPGVGSFRVKPERGLANLKTEKCHGAFENYCSVMHEGGILFR